MTEGGHRDHQDMLFHQAITSGKRIPLFLGGDFDVLTYLQRQAGADIGELGYATDGIPTVQSRDHAERDMTWAARYIKCDDDVSELCEAPEYKFRSKCWVDRADGVKPSVTQDEHLPGQVSWNQGWRMHQLRGRNLAMAVLQALRTAVSIWTENVRSELLFFRRRRYRQCRRSCLHVDVCLCRRGCLFFVFLYTFFFNSETNVPSAASRLPALICCSTHRSFFFLCCGYNRQSHYVTKTLYINEL